MVCRITTWFSLLCSSLFFTTVQGQVTHVAVEEGQSATLECKLLTATSVTWKVLKGSQGDVDLSTCSPFSGYCVDTQSRQYQGHITISRGGYTSTLVISSAKASETQFTCWTENGNLAANISLQVYGQVSYVAVEKGQSATLECKLLTATSVTWKMLSGSQWEVELSSCNRNTYLCADTRPQLYQGHITMSGGGYTSTLVISSVKTSETQFLCLTDNILTAKIILQVYGSLVINSLNCPIGPGVVGDNIKAGTSATCKCEIEYENFRGQAQWFAADGRKVGVDNSTDGSSTLTVTYNASDPDETYECRSIVSKIGSKSLIYKPKFPSPGCHVILEAGSSTQLECPVQGSINTLTWQVWTGKGYVNVTTCTPAGACVDQISPVYKGNISTSTDGPKFTLEVTSAKVTETQFRCLADGKSLVKICTLELYRWPSTPTGRIELTNDYVDVIYSTVAYPDVNAVVHRKETDLSDVDRKNSFCSYSSASSDPLSYNIISCTWRIPIARLFFSNTFYVEMSPHVTDDSIVRGYAVVGEDKVSQIGAVDVQLHNCPAGRGVNGMVIKNGTSATCTCTVSTTGLLDGHALWYTADGRVVGVEDYRRGSSTLTVSFNGSDPRATYECRGINPTRQYSKITYQPEFSSSDFGSAVHTTASHLLLLFITVSVGLIWK